AASADVCANNVRRSSSIIVRAAWGPLAPKRKPRRISAFSLETDTASALRLRIWKSVRGDSFQWIAMLSAVRDDHNFNHIRKTTKLAVSRGLKGRLNGWPHSNTDHFRLSYPHEIAPVSKTLADRKHNLTQRRVKGARPSRPSSDSPLRNPQIPPSPRMTAEE